MYSQFPMPSRILSVLACTSFLPHPANPDFCRGRPNVSIAVRIDVFPAPNALSYPFSANYCFFHKTLSVFWKAFFDYEELLESFERIYPQNRNLVVTRKAQQKGMPHSELLLF